MDLNELKGLSNEEAIKKAAEFAGVRPEILDGIWRTETGRGTHPTMIGPETKWGRAKGHFQQLDGIVDTFSKRTGKQLDPFNFTDGLYMAALHMRENVKRYGSEEQAVLAYHGGTNPKNWGTKTQDYLRKVAGGAEVKTPRVSSKPTEFVSDGIPEGFAAQLADLKAISSVPVVAAVQSAPVPAVQIDPLAGDYMPAAVEGDFRARVAQEADARDKPAVAHTWSEKQDSAYKNEMEPWFNIARQWQDGGPEKDLAWMRNAAANDTQVFGDVKNEEDRVFLREAVSAADLEYRKARLSERKGDEAITFGDGFWSGLGHSVVAGVRNPVAAVADLVAGAGVARIAKFGSLAARSGRAGVLVQGAAEGAVGSIAVDSLLTMAGEYRSTTDITAGAIAGAGLGSLFSVPAYRGASKAALQEFESDAINGALGGKLATLQEAVDELGPDADPAAIGRRAQQLEAGRMKDATTAALSAAPEGDRMPAAEVAPAAEDADVDLVNDVPTKTQADLSADTGMASANYRDNADMIVEQEGSWSQARRMGMDLADTPDIEARMRQVQDLNGQGVVLHGAARGNLLYENFAKVVADLRTQFKMDDVTFHVTDGGEALTGLEHGMHRLFGKNGSVIAVTPKGGLSTVIHEFGHAVMAHRVGGADLARQRELRAAWQAWRGSYAAPEQAQWSAMLRSPLTPSSKDPSTYSALAMRGEWEGSLRSLWMEAFPGDTARAAKYEKYYGNFDEYSAEQFAKFIEAEAAGMGTGKLSVPKMIFQMVADMIRYAKELFGFAKEHELIKPSAAFSDFFSDMLDGNSAKGLAPYGTDTQAMAMPVGGFKGPAMLSPEKPRITGADWDFARKYGLDLMPQNTPMERAEFKAVMGLYRKAEAWVAANPRLDERAQTLLNKSAMFQVTGTALASSDNPVARMVAGTLLESTTGAQGRRNTAAIAADMHNRRFLGNAVHAYTSTYDQWRKLHDGSIFDDVFKGTMRERFDRAVAMEIEGRRTGVKSNDPLVSRAADHLESAYERMRAAQVQTGTVGFAMLPDSAKGYMPHALNKAKVNAMTPDELRTFVDIMTEQFQSIEGFDAKFSAELARKYVDHARVNANGGHEIPANIHQPGAADMVRKALEDVGVGREELVEMMQRFSRGGPGYTKQRLHLDLNRQYGEVKLLDLYDTNQLELLRRYSRRVSGEVALAQHGVMGSQGLRLLRRAMEFGPDADKPELRQAFDQVAAEFLGQPFGNQTGKWMDRAMQANGLARLGMTGIVQAGEMVNAVSHIGVLQSLDTIPAIPRLRREVHAIARGEKVDNGILNSIEQYGGAGEFGVDGYRMVLPYDDPNAAYHSYGKDTVQAVDKVLRAGNYAQGILSGWRMIHAVQQRAVAEQITLKAIRYIRDGLESVALEDMGFTKSFQAKLRRDLPNMVQYDASGKVKVFDLTKSGDPELAATFAQAVLRGTNQIIQGQFIGETGKWAHDGWLKMFTQFRTFPLVAMEKQWARQRHNHGMLGAVGLLAGSIAAVSPLIMLRVAIQSVGRPDQDEYLEEKLQPAAIARMALNYVAMAGLAGDLIDALSAVAPDGLLGEETGARSGGARGAVGNLFAPSLGYVDDAYKAMQDADNPHKWAQLLPMSRLPFVIPLLNTLRDED